MGWKVNALAFLFALWALAAGAFVIGAPILGYLFYRAWSGRRRETRGTGGSRLTIYLGAFLLFLSFVAVAEHGTISPVVFGATGVALLAFGIFPEPVQGLADGV